MSASEFAFLALGLVLGVASGAALIVVLRSRPPVPREVRLTVAQDSVPRRASTLSTAAAPGSIGPAPFGPADRRGSDRPSPAQGSTVEAGGAGGVAVAAASRTDVLFSPPAAGSADAGNAGAGAVADGQAVRAPGADVAPSLVGIAIEPEEDGFLAAIRTAAVAAVGASAARSASGAFDGGDPFRAEGAGGSSEGGGSSGGAAPGDAVQGGGFPGGAAQGGAVSGGAVSAGGSVEGGPAVPGAPVGGGPGAGFATVGGAMTGPCADLRRIADERCAVADGLALQAEAALAALREKQRESDDHETNAARAADGSDPRLLRAAKETAQHVFRAASAAATSPTEVEAAARTWLQEINRINRVAREASLALRREREAVNELVPILERLSVEADAARINAEAAREACLAAREAAATCEEEAVRRQEALAAAALASQAAVPEPAAVPETAAVPQAAALGPDGRPLASGTGEGEPGPASTPAAGAGSRERDEGAAAGRAAAAAAADGLQAVRDPLVFHLLAGERVALRRAVEALAGEDPAEQGAWQLQLSELIDAVRSRAIEASSLDFPTEHRFWGPFTREQCRDIAAALGSLGYRFDGLGDFADDRVPSQRDLSLAVGFAGLDPMRIRIWPNESEMVDLFRDVRVAADEYISAAAPGLTLGEMVTLLGRRADGLTDLWNAWGRVRPLLLAPA